MTVGFDLKDQLDEPDGLYRFFKGRSRFIRNSCADPGHFFQLGFSCRIGFLFRHFRSQSTVSLCEFAHGFDHDQDCLVEYILVNGFRIRKIKTRFQGSCSLFVSLQTFLQHLFIIHSQMCITRIQLPFHSEDACFHKYGHFIRKQRLTSGSEVVILPERSDGSQLLLCLLGDIENVTVSFLEQIQLIHDEFQCVFRKYRSISVFGCLIAGQQRFIFNINGHVFENLFQHQCSHHDARLIFILFICLCRKNSTFRIYIRFFIQNFLTECLHSFCQ